MSTDSASRGIVRFFEDFVGIDVIADAPEYGVDTDPAVQIVEGGVNGVLRITMDAGQSNIGGINFGQTQWNAVKSSLYYEARVRLSALGTASERVFVGLTDVQEDTLTEFPFTGGTDVTTPVANPDDAIGFFWEGDMTGAYWAPASQAADSLQVHGSLLMTPEQKAKATITAGEWMNLAFRISNDGKYAEFYVNGETVYVHNGISPVVSDVALIPVFVGTEGTAAINADLDFVYVEQGRLA